jgi:hypothetical protein
MVPRHDGHSRAPRSRAEEDLRNPTPAPGSAWRRSVCRLTQFELISLLEKDLLIQCPVKEDGTMRGRDQMERAQGIYAKKSYWLLIGLVVLQATGVGLAIYFERENARRDLVLDQRTAAMIDDIFPELFQDLATVSRKASEIKQDVGDLKVQVSAVDDHVVGVGHKVLEVGRQVEDVNQNVYEYVQDRSGLVWGHSLNPYVLVVLLVSIAAGVPACGWFFAKARKHEEPRQEEAPDLGSFEVFSLRLDRLHLLLERIHSSDDSSPLPRPELRKLVEETERLIEETRAELALFMHSTDGQYDDGEKNPESLH